MNPGQSHKEKTGSNRNELLQKDTENVSNVDFLKKIETKKTFEII